MSKVWYGFFFYLFQRLGKVLESNSLKLVGRLLGHLLMKWTWGIWLMHSSGISWGFWYFFSNCCKKTLTSLVNNVPVRRNQFSYLIIGYLYFIYFRRISIKMWVATLKLNNLTPHTMLRFITYLQVERIHFLFMFRCCLGSLLWMQCGWCERNRIRKWGLSTYIRIYKLVYLRSRERKSLSDAPHALFTFSLKSVS